MEKVVLFGATGLLGKDLIKQNPSWIAAPRSIDLADKNAVFTYLSQQRPSWVINAAGMSNVDKAEEDPDLAFAINGEGVNFLATACETLNAGFIHFSTDYVFPEAVDRPFEEADRPAPVGLYAESKLKGEMAAATWKKHYILRVSALYGTGRRTHASWVLEALASKKPVKIAEDMAGSPTYTGDLAQWTAQIIQRKPPFGIYHLCHKGHCTRLEFAEKLCELRGAKRPFPIEKVKIKDLNLPAPRPGKPLLSVKKWEKEMGTLPSWEEGLKHYLADLDLESASR